MIYILAREDLKTYSYIYMITRTRTRTRLQIDNPYPICLQTLSDIPNLQNHHHVVLKCDSGLDQRVFNLPSSIEVAALIWVDENDRESIHVPHIQIYTQNNTTQRVNYYFGCHDPLQYPLLFPYGQSGWHCGIQKLPRAKKIYKKK
ncbi:hypothetical protein H5410_038977 [Solanum commersonii]|uniref:Uncharacterized protein n=1 Tax=Solanum commersonii TaxID=4109 RepID=A0A9J5YBP7_SOLCO|nr:hypothetical protein H5410_038977 [Solanum commersonii]